MTMDVNMVYEFRRMLEIVTKRLEEATTYKGDESSEWEHKETDLFWVQKARELHRKTHTL